MPGPRKDLSSKDKLELEELKNELSSSADSESYCGAFLSTPNSPVSVKSRVASFESLVDLSLSLSQPIIVNMSPADELKRIVGPLKHSRRTYKGWITRSLAQIEQNKVAQTLSKPFLLKEESSIKDCIANIQNIEIKIAEACFAHIPDPSEELEAAWTLDSEGVCEYISDTHQKLAQYEVHLDSVAAQALAAAAGAPQPGADGHDFAGLVSALNQSKGFPSKITLTCASFDGNVKDKFQFKNWLAQFDAVMTGSPATEDRFKLMYLKGKLTGLASQFVTNLELTNENYKIALDRLKKEFLDEGFIKDELIKQILNKQPGFDPKYDKTRTYLAEIENIMNDLTVNYNLDCKSIATSGNAIISQVVFSKLSPELQRGLINTTGNVYPNMDEIIANTNKVIHAVTRIKRIKPEIKQEPKEWKPNKASLNPDNNSSTTMNFATNSVRKKSVKPNYYTRHCRFCGIDGHNNAYCTSYVSLDDRIQKCNELKLCVTCTSPKHTADNCYGKTNSLSYPCRNCKAFSHAAAMCPTLAAVPVKSTPTHLCLSTAISDESPSLLPIFSIEMQGPRGSKVKFNALLDTGSSRSYLARNIVDKLNCDPKTFKLVDYDVKTFLGSGRKRLKEVTLEVHLPSKRYLALPILIDDQFRIDVEVNCLDKVISNFKDLNYNLAADFKNCKTNVPVHGLVGLDIIQFIKEMRVVSCMNGSAFQIATGIIPFGNCNHFLYPEQARQLSKIKATNNFNTIVSKVKCPSTHVNFVLAPSHSFEDPYESFFDESNVERRIDKMLSCDSLGIDEGIDEISDYDKGKIEQFKNGIQVIDKQIYVNLVWHDSIKNVPSNHSVALKVLDRVCNKLQSSGKLEDYCNIFEQQKAENIIEEFHCEPKDFHKYKWIPHRPVYKTDEQSTTKIRPVFNCSLKTGGCPSINEASYVGINLMADMLELLMLFCTNKNVLLGDLRKFVFND